MKDLLAEIEAGREIAKPRVLIGSDAGQNKLLVTLNVLDEENLQQSKTEIRVKISHIQK